MAGNKLPPDPRLPQPGTNDSSYDRELNARLYSLLRDISEQVNLLSETRASAHYNEDSVAPTSGIYRVGDFARNKDPAELGTALAKYVILGWVCTQEGSASASSFNQVRVLTGN